MKKSLFILGVAFIGLSAQARSINPYISAKFSENMGRYTDKSGGDELVFKDSVVGGSVALGLNFNKTFRLELEGFYNDKFKDNYSFSAYGYRWHIPLELETQGFFINGYYDINIPNCKFKPYIAAGIGQAWHKETLVMEDFGYENYSHDYHRFAYNGGLGFAYALTDNVDLDLGYRYENLGRKKSGDDDFKITNNKFSLGLRYTF